MSHSTPLSSMHRGVVIRSRTMDIYLLVTRAIGSALKI
jgi:hypothetical protein